MQYGFAARHQSTDEKSSKQASTVTSAVASRPIDPCETAAFRQVSITTKIPESSAVRQVDRVKLVITERGISRRRTRSDLSSSKLSVCSVSLNHASCA